jgi:CheY-like chemotaxis protein
MTEAPTLILLVDDYLDAVEMWGIYFRHCGYEVLSATDGLEAVEMAKRHVPDLVILDLDLPGITGFEAARRLRELPGTANIPLVAATGFSHAKQLDEARASGFEAVLVKPFEPAVLAAEVERVLSAVKHRAP